MDFTRERARFPILSERVYFAQQCLGATPAEMEADLGAYAASLARRSRALGEWAERWWEMHRLVESLLSAPPGSVFLRDSATAAQAAVASALDARPERSRVIVGTADFHSSRYLWRAQASRGFDVVEVQTLGAAADDAVRIASMIDEHTRVVALSLVSPRTGALLDTAPIVRAARRAGAIVVLDAYQAVGIVPVRVGELGAHVVVGGFHKWVGGGGTGLAFGYVEPSLLPQLRPAYPGWLAHRDLMGFCDDFEAAHTAEKLQQGMPAMEPVYSTRAGLEWILAHGIDPIRARSLELTDRILAAAEERRLPVITPRAAARRGGMVCIDVPDGKRLVAELAVDGIDIDARPGAGIRLGPHPAATFEQCDHVVERIAARLT